MASTHSIEIPIAVLPEDWDGTGEIVRCFTLYDWQREFSPERLDVAESIFAEFRVTAYEATARRGEDKSSGRYRRIRKRLVQFLDTANGQHRPDFLIQSQPTTKAEAFFPCDLEMAWAVTLAHRKQLMVAVLATHAASCGDVITRIGQSLFELTGAAYGAAFDFPARYGPTFYLSSLSTIPRGTSSVANEHYTDRLTRWRANWPHASQGYFREIYPINFVLDGHLRMPFEGQPLSDFMDNVGDLHPSQYAEGMYRWDVPPDRLETVRHELEHSGLILSSATPPLFESDNKL